MPRWEPTASVLLRAACRRISLIAWATPSNLHAELAGLERDWRRGQSRSPRFRYAPAELPPTALGEELRREASRWVRRGSLGRLYAARAQELALELAIGHALDGPHFAALSSHRFARRDRFDDEADQTSAQWLAAAERPGDGSIRIRSDDPRDPRSLVRRLQDEVSRRRLDAEVVPTARLAALAATGPRVIYVAAARSLSPTDVERTVVHEVLGHALPHHRAQRCPLGLFACGTARGADDQEGRALALERAAGLLDPPRRLELALRHTAARAVERGASFVETTRALAAHPVALGDRLRIAARAHRGGGLARERVYLGAYLRVTAARVATPWIDDVLGRGAVAVGAAGELRGWTG